MATYLFLSDDWLDAARAIRAEYEGGGGAIAACLRTGFCIH